MSLVESRYSRYQSAKARNASPDELVQICGKVDFTQQQCTTTVGRPKDSESLACDSLCCLSGKKVGNCGSDYGVKLDFVKLVSALASGGGIVGGAIAAVKPEVAANCYCSDDPIDVRCGRDGSFMNIRCPDNSACWRKCCREGKSDGSCGGMFKLSCKCK